MPFKSQQHFIEELEKAGELIRIKELLIRIWYSIPGFLIERPGSITIAGLKKKVGVGV